MMEQYDGSMPVLVCLREDGINREFHINYKISFNSDFIPEVKKILGEESIIYFPS
jgi:hypothetical protein